MSFSDADHVMTLLGESLRTSLDQEPGPYSPLGDTELVGDATSKILIRSRNGRPICVVSYGRKDAGVLIRRNVAGSLAAKSALGPVLGRNVLTPFAWGDEDGLHFAAYQFCRPLRIRRLSIAHRWIRVRLVLNWLRSVTSVTRVPARPSEVESGFVSPLEQMLGEPRLPQDLRAELLVATGRLNAHEWIPHHSLTHYDFWIGNILQPSAQMNGPKFVVIDWPGSVLRGYGIFDLIRFSRSVALPSLMLRTEVERHCKILDCDLADARSYLAISLALLGTRLGHFPWQRYIQLSQRCFAILDAAGVNR